MIRDRDDAELRFRAALHGRRLPDREGRVHGLRGDVMARLKRRGAH